MRNRESSKNSFLRTKNSSHVLFCSLLSCKIILCQSYILIISLLLLIILGNSYKFQAGNRMNAMLWFKHLSAACQSNKQQVSNFS